MGLFTNGKCMEIMTIDQIISNHTVIERRLFKALATMDRKEDIQILREQLIELQDKCPHFSTKYNWEVVDGTCPYCGKNLDKTGD